jgi:hypothetical protein
VRGSSGIEADAAQIDVARTYVHDVAGVGIYTSGLPPRIVDSVIDGVRNGSQPEGSGTGIEIFGAGAQLSGVRVSNVTTGIAVIRPMGDIVDISSCVISDVAPPVGSTVSGGMRVSSALSFPIALVPASWRTALTRFWT